ncbi:MAG: hypothetical protein KAF40_01930 [Flavihumibacter sp.]|nr:hypothetical protein [Flavihumibacter sp.]
MLKRDKRRFTAYGQQFVLVVGCIISVNQQNSVSSIKSKIKVAAFSISLDGFGAGPNQSLEQPLGVRGEELHQWVFQKNLH